MWQFSVNHIFVLPVRRTVVGFTGIRKSYAMSIRCISEKAFNLMGGGLEKLQGSYKEEQYFHNRNKELLVKMRQELKSLEANPELEGNKLIETAADPSTDQAHIHLNENDNSIKLTASDWNKLNKKLKSKMDRTVLQESCLLSKHKNCREELFFYNEQCECIQRFKNQAHTDEKKKHQNS